MIKKSIVLAALCLIGGCGTPAIDNAPSGKHGKVIVLYSEYPSWSIFGVADKQNLIDGDEGKLGPLEEKYNTDIVLALRTYPVCINEYGAVANTAVCITNVRSAT